MSELRPRKPSAGVPTEWKCGHAMNLDFVDQGFSHCPFCGSKYHIRILKLIHRWRQYNKWHSRHHGMSYPIPFTEVKK